MDDTNPLTIRDSRLAANARGYRPDPQLDPIADRIDNGDPCADVHPLLFDRASIYRDFRTQYRAAVDAGKIPDDRSA